MFKKAEYMISMALLDQGPSLPRDHHLVRGSLHQHTGLQATMARAQPCFILPPS
jgi:hypothetical protein